MTMAEITNSHLRNIINHLRQRYAEYLCQGYSALTFLQGEMAQWCAETEIERESEEIFEMVGFFEAEARERGMTL